MTKAELFLKLAQPDESGHSRQVSVDEFEEEYAPLKLGNGLGWGRKETKLAKKYNIEKEKKGNKITAIRLAGFKNDD